jgi:tryptophan 2,3-dioxygenase
VVDRLGVSKSFGEEGGRLDYGSYLGLETLLSAQQRRTEAHDELLFITVHQIYELWFQQLLFELEAARDAMFAGEIARVRHVFRRVRVIERLLVEQVDVLETMTPQDFLTFRSELEPASGFQSVQYREIEFLSGLKDPAYLERVHATAEEQARLERRLIEPSLWDGYLALLAQCGNPELVDVLLDREQYGPLFEVSEDLLDHDQAFVLWRVRHVTMVERQIGGRPGTGGSTGAGYLRSTLDRRFFPELWAVRDRL